MFLLDDYEVVLAGLILSLAVPVLALSISKFSRPSRAGIERKTTYES